MFYGLTDSENFNNNDKQEKSCFLPYENKLK